MQEIATLKSRSLKLFCDKARKNHAVICDVTVGEAAKNKKHEEYKHAAQRQQYCP